MKKLMFVSMVLAVISFTACGQKTDVPAKVKSAFAEKFPTAKKVTWDKENEHEWEAEFKMKGQEYSANFDEEGQWKETEREIKLSEVPAAVKNTIDNDFSGYEIEEVEMAEKSEGKMFEFHMEKDETDMEVVIASDGSVVKKKEEVEEDEEAEEEYEDDEDEDENNDEDENDDD